MISGEAKSIAHAIAELANLTDFADRPALCEPSGRSVTYAQLAEEIWDGKLRGFENTLEMLVFSRSLDCVVRYLALIAKGCTVLVLPQGLKPMAVKQMISEYQPRAIHGQASDLKQLDFELNNLDGDLSEVCLHYDKAAPTCETQQLLLLTSGSTGSSRAVRLSNEAVLINARDISTALGISPENVGLTSLPLFYTYGLSVLHSHLLSGAQIYCSAHEVLQPGFRELLAMTKISSLSGVPFSYQQFERLGLIDNPPPFLTAFTQAGGKLEAERVRSIARRLNTSHRELFVMYGQTEATARICVLPSHLAADNPDSVGFAVDSGRLSIGSSNSPDEVIFTGPNVMLGYADKFADLSKGDQLRGSLETGDLGSIREGLLYLHGRIKRIAKLNGIRVSLDDVEQELSRFGNFAAIHLDGKIRLYTEEEISLELIRDALLARVQIRNHDLVLERVSTLPRLPSGKIDYRQLEER